MTRTRLIGMVLLSVAGVAGCNFGNSSQAGDAGFDGSIPGSVTLVAPSSEDFGTVTVGASSAPVAVVVSSAGGALTGPLVVTLGGADAASFAIDVDTCSGKSLDTGTTCDLKLHFAPKSAGPRTATLTISGQPGGSLVVALTGTGGAGGPLAVSPAQQDFAIVATGASSSPVAFVFSNPAQSATGPLMVALTGGDASQFKLDDPCSGKPLTAGGQCSVNVTFAPGSTGAKMATLTGITAGAGTASAALTGTGAAPAAFAVTPATFDFGSVPESTSTAGQSFAVKNTGGVPSGTPAVAVSGANAGDFAVQGSTCGTALSAGAACSFSIVFTPTTAAAETATVTVSAPSTASGTTSLQGAGLPPGAIAITPTSQPFGSFMPGQTSPDTTFTLTNNGGVATGALAVSLGGTNAGQFGTAQDKCTGAVLAAAGGTCTVNAHFAPTTGTLGAVQATLSVTGTPGGTAAAQLSGTALAPASLTIAPPTQDFGSWSWGTSSPDTVFTVTNGGGVATGKLTVSIPGSQFFAGTTDTCTGNTVAPNATCKVSAHFSPPTNAATPASGTLTVTDSVVTASAALSGASTAPTLLLLTPLAGFTGFGTVVIPNQATASFTVTNSGGQTSGTITMSLDPTGSAEYSLTADGCTGLQLAPTGVCKVSVVFTASAAGPANTKLLLAASPGGPLSYAITGAGATQASLAISPPVGFTGFGTQLSGTTGPDYAFTVTNNGGVNSGALAVSLGSLVPAGAYGITLPDACQGLVLGPAKSCTVNVHFQPPSGSSGTETGALDVTGSPGGTPTSPLTGTAQAPAQLVLTPPTGFTGFGNVLMGHSSPAATFTLSNSGQQASSTPMVSTGNADFVVSNSTCTGPVVNGTPCTFNVVFTPTAPARAESATLTATTTIGQGTTYALTGTGVTLVIDVTNWTGSTNYGGSATQTFTVTNPSPMTTFGKVLSSLSGARYSLQGGTCTQGQNLVGLGKCTAIVTYTAGTTSPGEEDVGTLTVTDTAVDSVSASLDWFFGVVALPNPAVFPNTARGSSSSLTVTVTNHENAAVGPITRFFFGGNYPSSYSITSNGCLNVTLAAFGQAGSSCSMQVTFAPPATGAAGAQPETLGMGPPCGAACFLTTSTNLQGTAL